MALVVKGMTPVIREFVSLQVENLLAKIAVLEQRVAVAEQRAMTPGPIGPAGPSGQDGKSIDPAALTEAIGVAAKQVVADLPGPDVDLHALAAKAAELIQPPAVDMVPINELVGQAALDAVARAFAELPRPKDGTSVTVDDVAPLIQSEVAKAVSALPVPKDGKDGVGVFGTVLDRSGHLVVTLSNGETKDVGPVVGQDGKDGQSVNMEIVQKTIIEEVAKIPRPKDGQDGIGWDDIAFSEDEHGRTIIKAMKGEHVKQARIFSIVDRGVWRSGESYLKGDGVTWAGSFWIAQAETTDKPGEGQTQWRLAVKSGRDGKAGANGKDGAPGRDGRDLLTKPHGGSF